MHDSFSYTQLSNLPYIEELYQNWRKDARSVDVSWAYFFEGMQFAEGRALPAAAEDSDLPVYLLITAYRTFGHLAAQFNPVSDPKPLPSELQLATYGLGDLERDYATFGVMAAQRAPLKEILAKLEAIYTNKIGFEFTHITDTTLRSWIQKEVETRFDQAVSKEKKLAILHELNRAEVFETFLHTKYVGQKRFSLEGAETLIPMLIELLHGAPFLGVQDLILGMAHRGRLNVLAHILGKSYSYLFREFEDHYTPDLSEGTGDVKYHKGFSTTYQIADQKSIRVILAANPSHLESVDPIAEGGARALQQQRSQDEAASVLPLLIHGDASVSGQGVVYETMELCRLSGYTTHGTLHVVINNQIGFTTTPEEGRSTLYCSDIAKMFDAPVFHVNVEDPEGAVKAMLLALEIRQKFGCEVFIDLNGYRKYGHNESDEPAYTQPLLYQKIRSKKSARSLYREALIQEGALDETTIETLEKEFRELLAEAFAEAKKMQERKAASVTSAAASEVMTRFDLSRLKELGHKIWQVPKDFHLHPKIERIMKERKAMLSEDPAQAAIDWGVAEQLAFASLLEEGVHVRLSGQDCQRGTFAHRHAIWTDQLNGETYCALDHISEGQASCCIYNSPLSEFAVLGFEFGYSLLYPRSLILWEAQYGDFVNGAQIIIDQYIASAEQKWGHKSHLTLLLPHGYQGEGPEHSSARIERFLQGAAEENMRIVNATTPAQLFHLLRRQALAEIKKPLILFTPKSLLRHPLCLSPLQEFAKGHFNEILDDASVNAEHVLWVCFCSGKIYYDLLAERAQRKVDGAFALVRIEQLYPLDNERLKTIFQKYRQAKGFLWVQEEPQNMGAYHYIRPLLESISDKKNAIEYVGRGPSASTAAGSFHLHKQQYDALMQKLFARKS